MSKFLHRFGAALLLASLQGAPAVVLARPMSSFAECAAIAADSDRLACYDRAAGRTDTPASASGPSPANAKKAASPATAASAKGSLIDSAWEFDPASSPYVVRPYEANYLLVARHSNNVNTAPFSPLFQAAGPQEDIDNTEAKFQISFKGRLWTTDDRRWGAWFGYTQQSHWRMYDPASSRPFRETIYMPELFVSYRPGLEYGGFHWRLLNFGVNHQSNGRSDTLSRSWNRLFAKFGVERDNLVLVADAWYRIKESADEDDNPDITDYYGHGSLTATYKWREQSFSLMGRGNLSTGKGAVQATWMSHKLLGPLRAYVQAFSGYGESLIDYNWNQKTIGAGIALNDAF
jgi:phospholipase A1/A2